PDRPQLSIGNGKETEKQGSIVSKPGAPPADRFENGLSLHPSAGSIPPRGPLRGPGRPGWLPTQVSGKEVTSPPPPPLRTARESFPSCSSSLSNALRRTRLSHI